MKSWVFAILLPLIHYCCCVDVHFEAADSGFFLKHSRQSIVSPEKSKSRPFNKTRTSYNALLSVDRFTVVQTTQPVSIRASYGPFSTKQTVPARYIVPDAVENSPHYVNNTTAALIELQQSNIHLDISAHLIRSSIPQDSPVLRVLFHAGADPSGHLQRQRICILLHVANGNQVPLKGRCMPEGEDGVCVAEVVVPLNWWPSLPTPLLKNTQTAAPVKVPQRFVQVSYSVFEPPLRNPEQCEPKVQIQPLTSFSQVPLVSASLPFKELRADDLLTILIPQQPLYPSAKFHVPVFLHQSTENHISAFTLKARVKSGLKILAATTSSESWNISIEKENSKHTTARVTATREDIKSNINNENVPEFHTQNSVTEIFSWLLEVAVDTKELLDGGKIVWSVTYVFNNSKTKDFSENFAHEDTKKKLIAKFEINKDDIQAVLPMAKNWELMNTAVLTGRQVAQAMKVFIVSQGGKIADVTLQSSCYAEDESVIKVSSSCSSVYVDGSEIRGSSNASIVVKYGTYIGLAKFIVWMPEFPLEIYIADFRLSQIKGWKVVDENLHLHKKSRRKKRSLVVGQPIIGINSSADSDKVTCRARYQQSPVEVYARFIAIDQNSGRISYFITRRTGLRVTDLVQPLLRVADPKIASLKGKILQGKSMGRTDVQVLSPITGRVIGTKEIRVGSDKVNLVKLVVRVVSGLQLTIIPDNTIENGYIAETAITHKLTAQYQEGLLDIDLEFSDGLRTPLRDVPVEDYFLLVESLDTEVVAFAPMLASHHPRVIAVGEGNGNLLRVTLLLADDCRVRRNLVSNKQTKLNSAPLASALAPVEVDFASTNDIASNHELVQNDGIMGKDKKNVRSSGDLADIIGVPLKDSIHRHEPTVQARQHRGSIFSTDKIVHEKRNSKGKMSSMEVGMYVLLTAFCFAIIVFLISCVVYASKFKPAESGLDNGNIPRGTFGSRIKFHESKLQQENTTNAHDWVWLGRSTMDRSSILADSLEEQTFFNPRDHKIRITTNPFIKYVDNNNTNKNTASLYLNSNQQLCATNINCSRNEMKSAGINYRPPVPPHRNIDIRAHSNHTNQSVIDSYVPHAEGDQCNIPKSHLISPEIDSSPKEKLAAFSTNIVSTQHDVQQSSTDQAMSDVTGVEKMTDNTMHNAEKLVENATFPRNVFQFDSLPQQKPLKAQNRLLLDDFSNKNLNILSKENDTAGNENVTDIVFEPESGQSTSFHVKRATIVGNPVFASTESGDSEPNECLNLDDLDMDYEQIRQYFENLKESNA